MPAEGEKAKEAKQIETIKRRTQTLRYTVPAPQVGSLYSCRPKIDGPIFWEGIQVCKSTQTRVLEQTAVRKRGVFRKQAVVRKLKVVGRLRQDGLIQSDRRHDGIAHVRICLGGRQELPRRWIWKLGRITSDCSGLAHRRIAHREGAGDGWVSLG